MTKSLAGITTGRLLYAQCPHCKGIKMPVFLGKEFSVHPGFRGNGRFVGCITSITPVKGFGLDRLAQCPNCNRMFALVIAVSQGKSHRPLIFAEQTD